MVNCVGGPSPCTPSCFTHPWVSWPSWLFPGPTDLHVGTAQTGCKQKSLSNRSRGKGNDTCREISWHGGKIDIDMIVEMGAAC